MTESRQISTLHRDRAFDIERIAWIGREGRPLEKVVVRHHGAVAVVPVLADGRLVLIRNYRITLERWLLEFCAGGIGRGEAAEAAARRELAEETGYRGGRFERLGEFFTTPGFTDERMQVFVASDLEAGEARLEPDERIEVAVLTAEEVGQKIASGEIRDGKTIAAFHLWGLRGGLAP